MIPGTSTYLVVLCKQNSVLLSAFVLEEIDLLLDKKLRTQSMNFI